MNIYMYVSEHDSKRRAPIVFPLVIKRTRR